MKRTDPVTGICNAAMNLVADAIHTARPGSPLREAWTALGTDRGAAVITRSLRARLLDLLTDEQVRRDVLDGVHLAADAALAGVVADTVADIIEAARVERAA